MVGDKIERIKTYYEGTHGFLIEGDEDEIDLVRCKDCKHFDGIDCRVNDIVNIMNTDWFCADGERKET